MSGFVYIRNMSLNHTTSKLILIRIRRDYKDGKTLPWNRTAFPEFELDTIRRDSNYLTYMFDDFDG